MPSDRIAFFETIADHLELFKSLRFHGLSWKAAVLVELVLCALSYALLQKHVDINYLSAANEKSKSV